MIQPGLDAGKRAFRAERTDMQLVDDSFVPGPAGPVVVSPLEFGWINDLARSVDILGVQAGGRIGDFVFTVDPVAVQRTGTRFVTDHFIEARIVPGHAAGSSPRRGRHPGKSSTLRAPGAHNRNRTCPSSVNSAPKGMLCRRFVTGMAVSRNSARDRPCNG